MEDIHNDIHEMRRRQRMNIIKGFEGGEEELEKAMRKPGETKVGADGVTRVWTQLASGKYDWRRKKGDDKKTSTDSKKELAKPFDRGDEVSLGQYKFTVAGYTDDGRMKVMTQSNEKFTLTKEQTEKVHKKDSDKANKAAEKDEKKDEKKEVKKETPKKDDSAKSELMKQNKQNFKDILDEKKSILNQLKSEGHTKDHKDYKRVEQAFDKFKELAPAVLKKLGKQYKISFKKEYDSKYKDLSFTVLFDSYELKDKFPDDYEKSSAGLASSKLNNFAAKKSGELLDKIFNSNFSNSGSYSYFGSRVGHILIQSGESYGINAKSIKQS